MLLVHKVTIYLYNSLPIKLYYKCLMPNIWIENTFACITAGSQYDARFALHILHCIRHMYSQPLCVCNCVNYIAYVPCVGIDKCSIFTYDMQGNLRFHQSGGSFLRRTGLLTLHSAYCK